MEGPARFVARYATQTFTGSSFSEVGDKLAGRGFDMTRMCHIEDHTYRVPHRDPHRRPAYIVHTPAPPEPPPVLPVPIDLQKAMLIAAALSNRTMEPIPLTCRECGAIHPEGAVCVLPIYYEVKCCHETIYAHKGPHEAVNSGGIITHRWVEERVITDLPFNAYAPNGHDPDVC
jgi:hypothetical protein